MSKQDIVMIFGDCFGNLDREGRRVLAFIEDGRKQLMKRAGERDAGDTSGPSSSKKSKN